METQGFLVISIIIQYFIEHFPVTLQNSNRSNFVYSSKQLSSLFFQFSYR